MTNITEKSVLAKLLATENIHVEHRKVSTAHFDLESRTLCLPIWKEMSTDIYDLLIGHEVGHALETPTQEWSDAIDRVNGNGFKSFLNVIEDARIEIIMKNKYPGLRRSFYNGYRELFERNFFNTDGLDLSKMRLIDRINLHAKVGPFLNIPFTAAEQVILDRVMTAKTFDDVVSLATELYDGAKSEDISDLLEQLNAQMDDDGDMPVETSNEQQEDGDSGNSSGEPSEEQDNQDAADEDSESGQDAADDAETAEVSENEINSGGSTSNDQEFEEDPSSHTAEAFEVNEERLISANARENYYCILPKLNPEDFVVSSKVVDQLLQFETFDSSKNVEVELNNIYFEFVKNNQKYINAMVQQFERKKTAQQLRKAKVSKTGLLNMDKLWAHRISEDMFLQSTNMPDGKNHGMIMFLDLSGSMTYRMKQTVEQLAMLAIFCTKINIPFEVFGFINAGTVPDAYYESVSNRNNASNPKNLQIQHSGFRLLQLIATKTSGEQFKRQIKKLLAFGQSVSRYNRRGVTLTDKSRAYFQLGSTPLEESIIVGRHIADAFRKTHRVEVLSTVFLTDGEGDMNMYVTASDHWSANKRNIIVKDELTGRSATGKHKFGNQYSYKCDHYFDALHSIYEMATGSKITNIHLADRYAAKSILSKLNNAGMNVNDLRKELNKNGSVHIQVPSELGGFANRFLITDGSMKSDAETFDTTGTDRRELMRDFKKFQTSKHNNRAILSKMIESFV